MSKPSLSNASTRQPPLQARSQETRACILKAARKVFAESGFAAANVRDIARAAGTTHAMIRYHFGTKDSLWREAVREMFEALHEVFIAVRRDALDRNLDLRETYRSVTRAYTRYCAEHPEHARITIMESISGSERFNWMVREFVTQDHIMAERDFDELVKHGILPDIPFASYIYAFVGMTQLPFILAQEAKVAMDYDFLSEEAIERHADAVFSIWVGQDPVRPD